MDNPDSIQKKAPIEIQVYPYVNTNDPTNFTGASFTIFLETNLQGRNFGKSTVYFRIDSEYSIDPEGIATLHIHPIYPDEIDFYIQTAKTQGYSFFERLGLKRKIRQEVKNLIPERALPYILRPHIQEKLSKNGINFGTKLEDLIGLQELKSLEYEITESQMNPIPQPEKNSPDNILIFKKKK